MGSNYLLLCLLIMFMIQYSYLEGVKALKSEKLYSRCSNCDSSQCLASETYPHIIAFDGRLVAGALQSDYVNSNDRGLYLVHDVKGGQSKQYNAYFGWKSTSGSAYGYQR
ncbi:hypothetical protein Ddye_013720 [Dipteronia dyeriana]|uniref:Uncharacterized protein n=1 Tax=Dipteronia dyeriana TaxID=168575 RepID=A0AAD9X6W3_9ROSI|nr:hypothetical protein Ddye_013720 [Dipteronia dyeriana]